MGLGSLFGVEIRVDWSIIIIFLLVLTSLAMGLFPRWHPDWSAALTWGIALAAAVLFFVSILAHEMSHALVGRLFGVQIRRITLFLFGGMAHMEEDSNSPRAEFAMAIAGPLMSLAIGIVAVLVGSAMSSVDPSARPAEIASQLGPVATLLLWLGPINLLLAVFNMVPGYPLDGGRVLRATIWWATGSLHRATRWATGFGQGFAWLLMGLGAAMALGLRVPFFGTGLVSGLWLLFIGWFLNGAARMSYQQFLMMRSLDRVLVAEVMRARVETVTADLPVDLFVREHVMATEQRAYPVVEEPGSDVMAGLVTLDDVRKIEPSDWARTSVGEIMTPASELLVMAPGAQAVEALNRLAQRDVHQIPVVEEGRLRGVVRRQDIMRWLSLRSEGAPG